MKTKAIMSSERNMANAAIMNKGHAHKSKKDYNRKNLKQRLAKDIKML